MLPTVMDASKGDRLDLQILDCSYKRLNIREKRMPSLNKEVGEVGHICLTGGRVDDRLYRDAEIRQSEDKDEHPKYEVKHYGSVYTSFLPQW